MTPIFSECIWSPKLFNSPLANPTCGQIMLDTVEQQAELVPRFFPINENTGELHNDNHWVQNRG